MAKTCICLQKKNRGDDLIVMLPKGNHIEVQYRDGDRKGSYTFNIETEDISIYISELLISLAHDVDPFDYIQVTTPVGPSVLYNIWELEDLNMADIIENQISRGLRGEVTYNRFA